MYVQEVIMQLRHEILTLLGYQAKHSFNNMVSYLLKSA